LTNKKSTYDFWRRATALSTNESHLLFSNPFFTRTDFPAFDRTLALMHPTASDDFPVYIQPCLSCEKIVEDTPLLYFNGRETFVMRAKDRPRP
jgi:hypothetical protein